MGGFTNLCDVRSMGPSATGNKKIRELSRKASEGSKDTDTKVTLGGTAMQKCLGCNITYLKDGLIKAVWLKVFQGKVKGQGQQENTASSGFLLKV